MVQLRPHQEDILLALENNIKGQVISPTGSGKTMCMIKSTEKEFNSAKWDLVNKDCDRKTVVIVAPRILLAAQLSSEFIKNLKASPCTEKSTECLLNVRRFAFVSKPNITPDSI